MSWLQISLPTTAENAHALCDIMTAAGACTVTLVAANDESIYEAPGDASIIWSNTRVMGLFGETTDAESVLEFIRASLDLPKLTNYHLERLADEDWLGKWKEQSQPHCFGKRLWIYPSWYGSPHEGTANVILDPGLAFGSGSHPTTSMCLEWLDKQDITGWQIIDYGCGSGVLAIAAIKLGAIHAWAVDVDQQALEATTENAIINGIGQHITPLLPSELCQLQANCLIANILANPLLDLLPTFADLLAHGGHLVLSGILSDQTDKMITGLEQFFVLDAVLERDQWVCISARRQL